MELELQDVSPLLARTLKPTEVPRVTGWVAALRVLLSARYRDQIPAGSEPFFHVQVADAIQRRLDKPRQMVESESAGPFSVRWGNLRAWFGPEDLAEMDSVAGFGGARTYRTPAPDSQRFNNRMQTKPVPDDELDVIANTTLRGSYVPPG